VALVRALEAGVALSGTVSNEETYRLVLAANGAVGWIRAQSLRRSDAIKQS